MNAKKLARGLGWFSIGLGLTELIAPRALARFLGLSEERTGLLRFFGLREIAAGVGILMSPARPTPWVWARVGGDVLDIVGLGRALKNNPKKGSVGFTLSNVLAATAVDAVCARRLSSNLG
ncbi:hypothetical protein JY651_42210 [Pyxidicoccus parkwayensis]|uniref:Cyclase/dehydrase n=1 Tax=Pyxidicoccus parkwayensis TaxID=2813578 RepID=A0ABX7NS39_9BACT|nr:hypothetical protein [Pyxidicoccus parkwaysis]QSQ21707.1 hypothetical protein JY651_42210 [Pyxidicoccus parkwaysis]